MMKNKLLFAVLLSFVSSSAYAHPGHTGVGFLAGFSHPFTGIDHVLVMLGLGLWAGKMGGAARWQLPLTFVVIMAISAMFAFNAVFPLEMGLAVSVMAMGLLLALNLPIKRAFQLGLTAIFAMLHGLAHGAELSLSDGFQTLIGMVFATAMLHIAGMAIASQKNRMGSYVQATLALLTLITGGYLLLAV